MRGSKTGNLLLEGVLREQLPKFNRIYYKAKDYHFSEAGIREVIQKLKTQSMTACRKPIKLFTASLRRALLWGQNKSAPVMVPPYFERSCSISCADS